MIVPLSVKSGVEASSVTAPIASVSTMEIVGMLLTLYPSVSNPLPVLPAIVVVIVA